MADIAWISARPTSCTSIPPIAAPSTSSRIACPQFAIDCRGYADFAPLGHSVRVRREEDKATISWKVKFRDGREKNFVSPIRTTPWGSIKSPADYEAPSAEAMKSEQLAHEPEALKVAALPSLSRDRFKQGLG
jgi:adenylylsulfate reductase subunit B